ncbi:hypothetical protein [Paenibacillus sp. IHBB 10380]|uniref:hypothetical protein n=1 Tax=Paenibacillus sp. IHBB 10380 TaxID=1566358 RepID=UPI0005CFC6CC|nr:hypothetical protein [Paenibacillus sp. IHBB 10380]AJS58885.1 hypothetical protein UB51_10805 [Paenibacillus sp. IHBB 10380]
MENLKKELLLNVLIVSPILTFIWAGIATTIDEPSELIQHGPFLPFALAFLMMYPFNMLVSFVNYFIGIWVNLVISLISFGIKER